LWKVAPRTAESGDFAFKILFQTASQRQPDFGRPLSCSFGQIVGDPKQANRHVECACATCGYVVRTARKWLVEPGPPHCPRHGPMQPENL
jgi:hypothetical protein